MTIRVVCIAPDGSQTTVEREVPDDCKRKITRHNKTR